MHFVRIGNRRTDYMGTLTRIILVILDGFCYVKNLQACLQKHHRFDN